MFDENLDLHDYIIAAVVPAWQVEREIEVVLVGMPDYLRYVIVVDDCSPDQTAVL